jgi:hypothetical protein
MVWTATALQGDNHTVDRRGRDVEVALPVCFSRKGRRGFWCNSDEGQVLALLVGAGAFVDEDFEMSV